MFPKEFWPFRMFTERFWPKVGDDASGFANITALGDSIATRTVAFDNITTTRAIAIGNVTTTRTIDYGEVRA